MSLVIAIPFAHVLGWKIIPSRAEAMRRRVNRETHEPHETSPSPRWGEGQGEVLQPRTMPNTRTQFQTGDQAS